MSEILKQSMSSIWASTGDIVMPDVSKIADGWAVEVVPRQYWNWMQNRTDVNLAYLFQHGVPEWDATVEYIINKSFVQFNGVLYKAILTGTNQSPATATTYWERAAAPSTASSVALAGLTPAANTVPYYTGTTTAATTSLTAFARTILDDVDAAAVRVTIGAQPLDATLTALAGQTTAANKLSYFTGVDAVAVTDFTAFARTILDDADAVTVRATLGLGSAALNNTGDFQPIDSDLTAIAALTTTGLIERTGTGTAGIVTITAAGKALLDDADAAAQRTTLSLNNVDNTSDANKPISTATQTALNLKAPIASPTFTGVPAVPTAAVGTDTTQAASTAYVRANAVVKDSDVGSAAIPSGTTAQRTAAPVYGSLRANTTLMSMEWWNGTAWLPVGSGAGATGAGVGLGQDQIFNETDQLVTDNWTVGQGTMLSGATITIASPAVITFASHSFVVNQPVRFTTTGALPTGLAVNTPYYVIATGLTANSFQVSTVQGGAAVVTTGTQSGVHSVGKLKNALVTKELKIASGKSVTIPSGSSLVIVGASGGSEVADKYVNTFNAQDISGAKNFTVAPKLNGFDLTSIGIGQTWQDVTASRAWATTYTNTTGRPIMVSITAQDPAAGNLYIGLRVNGVKLAEQYHSAGSQAQVAAIIPPGATYMVERADTNDTITGWLELR